MQKIKLKYVLNGQKQSVSYFYNMQEVAEQMKIYTNDLPASKILQKNKQHNVRYYISIINTI